MHINALQTETRSHPITKQVAGKGRAENLTANQVTAVLVQQTF